MAKYNSGRQKKFNASGLTTDRYQFLGLEQAEPDLGDPLVGVSSVGAKPAPAGDQYLVVAIGGDESSRYWIRGTDLVSQGIQGVQGTQGAQGTQGTHGIQGAQGTQGVQGLQGAQGTQGLL